MAIWRCYYARRGNHVHCRLFAGDREGALGMIGKLCFTVDQFTEFTKILAVIAVDFRPSAAEEASVSSIFIVEAERAEEGWWAIGTPLIKGGVRVRRLVRGRLIARQVKRRGEKIVKALVIVDYRDP